MTRIGILVSVALALAPAIPAQELATRADAEAARVTPVVTEIRHQLHQNPGLSNHEVKTAALVADLRTLGPEGQTGVAHTGIVARLEGSSTPR